MKIASLAIAALFGVAEARKVTDNDLRTLQARATEGKVNKRTLMRGATPYSAAAKRRMEEEEWEINGYYSVEFDTCLSLKTANEDLFEDELVSYAANGLVTSATSYILFTVCETSSCYYQSSSQKMTFITDIATYFQALSEYLPNQVQQYCEGCEQNEDYCMGNLQMDDQAQQEEDEAEEDEDEESGEEDEESGDGEDRKLAGKRRRLGNQRVVEYINCNQCEAYECFNNDEEERKLEEVAYDMESAVEWINELAECKELEDIAYNDVALYAGLMCNAKGTGVEIAVFMDDECSLYTTVKSFADVMSYDDKQYFSISQDMVQYTFTNKFDCENIEVEYTNPYEENQDEEDESEDDGEAPEAAEYCTDLFDETVDMYDCGADQDADEDQDAEDEDYNLSSYEWYSYELTQDQAEDAASVCQVLNGWDSDSGKSKSYQGKTVYDEKSSGTLYKYKKGRNSGSGSGGSTAAIVVFVVIIVGAVGFMFFKNKNADSKKAPLINANSNGQMA
jgi:hypothetical protein